ncbi:uncharacterized protein LOC144014875 [Festucalex cinctus]
MLFSRTFWYQGEEVPRPLLLCCVGKRRRLHSVAAVSGGAECRLLFIMDTLSRLKFLCDSGARRSVLPASAEGAAGGTHGPHLSAANDAPIRTYGTKTECVFGVPSIQYLGHLINEDGATPLPAKVEAVAAFPRPRTAQGLREFLGMLTFYHRFFRLFRFILEGREFTVFVDHMPLAFSMSKLSEPWSARQQRQLSFISGYTTDIRHIAGKDDVVADCLSRAAVNTVQLGLDFSRMAADQASDRDTQSLRGSDTGLQVKPAHVDLAGPLDVPRAPAAAAPLGCALWTVWGPFQ